MRREEIADNRRTIVCGEVRGRMRRGVQYRFFRIVALQRWLAENVHVRWQPNM